MSSQAIWPRVILLDFYGTVVKEDDVPIASVCDEIARASTNRVLKRGGLLLEPNI